MPDDLEEEDTKSTETEGDKVETQEEGDGGEEEVSSADMFDEMWINLCTLILYL